METGLQTDIPLAPPALLEVAAECYGVKVPESGFLNPMRIERINAGRYEGQEIAGALTVVRAGDRILELGAGLGLVGAIVAQNAAPEKVLSFEANPELIQAIRLLHQMNGLEDRVEVRNEVLMSGPDIAPTVPFHLRNSYLGSSLSDHSGRAVRTVDVRTTRYAVIKATFAPDVLIMDIEGGELEFLRHASLTDIRALVIEFHPDVYGPKGMRECKRIIAAAGFAKVPDHCTRTVWTCVRAPKETPPQPDGGWSTGIETYENAVLVPATEQQFVQPSGLLTQSGDYIATGALWRNGRVLTTRPALPSGDIPLRRGTWLWGGVLWMHFGHFVVESMARLWALHHLDEELDGILFIPKRPRNADAVLDYQRDLIWLSGSSAEIACAAGPETVERLIVPGQGIGLGKLIMGTAAYRAAVKAQFARDIAPDGPEKLYISRSGLPDGRGALVGEDRLESTLAEAGYTVYHPERHDIRHQIATYKAARQVIASEGSALHLVAMVANPEAEIAMIVRRPSGATRNLEAHVSSLTGKPLRTLTHLVRSWKPAGAAKARMWKGEPDLPQIRTSLIEGGFLPAGSPDWPQLTEAEVRERLGDGYEEVPDA